MTTDLGNSLAPLDEIIATAIVSHLIEAAWNQRAAARSLGVSRWKLARLIVKHGIELPPKEGR